jgi:hypothetical protein
MEGGVSASSAWQLLWWVGAIFCVLAGAWFLALAVPDERSPLAWVLALAFGLVCIAAAASLRRLLREAFVSPGPVSYSSALLVTSLWAFAETLGRFLDEAAFRILLCWRVLTGQLPQKIEHRSWKPERESPVIINVYDWVSYTLIFSILVWPPADVAAETLEKAEYYKLQRAEDVMAAITRGAGQMKWSLLYEREERLVWDRRRAVWVCQGNPGAAYDHPGVDR